MDSEPLKLNIPLDDQKIPSIIDYETLSKRHNGRPSKIGTTELMDTLTKSQLSSLNNIERHSRQRIDKPNEGDTPISSINQIIKKNDRSDEEAWILYQYLKDYKFFNLFTSMTNEVYQKEYLIHIFKKLEYEECLTGQVLFEEGDASNGKMYIVLSGRLLVMTKRIDTIGLSNMEATQNVYKSFRTSKKLLIEDSVMFDAEDRVLRRSDSNKNVHDSIHDAPNSHRRSSRKSIVRVTPSPKRKTSTNSRKSHFEFDEEPNSAPLSLFGKQRKEEDHHGNRDISYYGYVRDIVEQGGYFGERALETNQKRSASIIAETNCQMFVLTKEEFLLIKKTFYNKVRDLFNFVIDNMPGLNHIQRPLISENYVYLFEERILNFKNHLFHEGESGDTFYLIYNGTCEVYRTISIEEQSTLPIAYSKVKTFFAKSNRIKEKIPLAIVNEGCLIGEEILQMEKPVYSYSVQVTSDSCKVLAMNKNRFRFKFSKDTIDHINSMYLEKKLHKDQTLVEQLGKRDLELEDTNIDTLFLKTKRNIVQNLAVEENPKINRGSVHYNSYKRITPHENYEPKSSTLKEHRSKKDITAINGDFSSKVRSSTYLKSNSQFNIIDNDHTALDFLEENRFFEPEGNKERRNLFKKGEGSPTNSGLPAIERNSTKKHSAFSPTSQSTLFKNRSVAKFESDLSPLNLHERRKKKPLEYKAGKSLYFTGSEINSPQFKDAIPLISHQINMERINTLPDPVTRDPENGPKEYFLPFPGNLKTEESSPTMQSDDSVENSYGSTPVRSIMKSFQSGNSPVPLWIQKGLMNPNNPSKQRIFARSPIIITKSPIFPSKDVHGKSGNMSPIEFNDKSGQFRPQIKEKKKKVVSRLNSMQKEKLKKFVENMQNGGKKKSNKSTQNESKGLLLPLISPPKSIKQINQKGTESWIKMNPAFLRNVSLEECFFSGFKY